MNLRGILACALTAAAMPIIPTVYAAELFSGTYMPEDFTVDETNGVVFEQAVPDGDYTVTVKTGGDTETNANVYINGGERVRAYTLEAGETQDNEQPVVPKDGKITVQVLGENPNVTEIDIEQLPERKEAGEKPTIYIAGDSTAQTYDYKKVFPQTGWGQVFGEFFTDDIAVENRSMGGRSSKSYNNDGRLDRILTEMHPGDYVFIQFGINDGAVEKPERYISVDDYKELITDKYIGEVKKRGGIPVLLTATAASWWDEENNCFMESRQDYADPTREIAEETGVDFIDINKELTEAWNTYASEKGKEYVFDMYFICEPLESKAYPAGTDDHTHIKEAGARYIAKTIADDVKNSSMDIAKYVKADEKFTDISNHWAKENIESAQDLGLIDGISGEIFEPDRYVTRAEFLKMAMKATNISAHAYRDDECLDANADDWYCYWLQGAIDKGIIPYQMIENCTGTEQYQKEIDENTSVDAVRYIGENMKFDADKAITREEMAAIAMNCVEIAELQADKANSENAATKDFADKEDISEIYASKVDESRLLGVVEGDDDNMFLPENNLTRAEAVTVLFKINKMNNQEGDK